MADAHARNGSAGEPLMANATATAAEKSGALVRRLRAEHQWTQAQLAERLGVDRRTVIAWEAGRRRPMPFLLTRLKELR